jgi:zinc protease
MMYVYLRSYRSFIMWLFRRMSVIIAVMTFLIHFAAAQDAEQTVAALGLGSELPFNPNVRSGVLPNGMKYYVMKNSRPENRAALRLAVNAGSVLETDEEQGLAHFVEHMCFNGTKNFPKNKLVEYLESIGMRFGADLNAYTSFDETVYMLELPMDDDGVVTNGMQVLVDWAHAVTFEHDEIDKERGVIMEEWRSRKGAASRIRDVQFPVLLKGSLYANRMPIGLPEVIENSPYESLKGFYRKWYRPDNMAIIAVGDFDVDQMEKKIAAMFGAIPEHDTPLNRPVPAVPDHEELLFTSATDPEATSSSVTMYVKRETRRRENVADYRRIMAEQLYARMLNERYSELLQQADPPFVSAAARSGGFVRSKDAFMLSTSPREGEAERAFEALLKEAMRVKQHGFTASELERAKTNALRRMEQRFNERDKTQSGSHASELTRHFLTAEPVPGIEIEYEIYKRFMPTITLREVNRLTNEFLTEENRVIAVSMPDKPGLTPPTEEQMRAVIAKVEAMELDAYVDEVANKPLVEVGPSTVTVIEEAAYDDIDITEWKLSNGVRVLFKKTDFKADEILFSATSPGGLSLVADEDLPSGAMASNIITMGGVGEFDMIQLRKTLAGKVVNVSPTIGSESEGFSGSFAPKDMETAFQLIYLYFHQPRKDTTSFISFKTRMMSMFENFGNMPERVFSDTLTRTMSNYHPRSQSVNTEWLERVDLDKAFDIYTDRFRDASDFTFVFVGNITPDDLKPMVEQYLGQLPVINRREIWKNHNIKAPRGIVEKTVQKGVDDKTMVGFVMTGPFDWTYKNRYVLTSLREYLNIVLRESIREDKGGTYGVGVMARAEKYPESEYMIMINFGTSPDRLDEMIETMREVLTDVLHNPPSEENLGKIKEIQRRERETSMKENNFWLGQLVRAVSLNEPLNEFLEYERMIDALTADMILDAARTYITLDEYIQVLLLPEDKD